MKRKLCFLFIMIAWLIKPLFAQVRESLKITPLNEEFYIFTTYQTFKGERISSNGLYFLTADGVVMIDTPWDSTQYQPLLDSITARHHKKVVACIATHSHEDRTGGFGFLKSNGIKTYSSQQTYKMGNEQKAEFRFSRDTTFKIGEVKFQTFFGGEGHTKDNIVIWFNEQKILYGGCLIKSTEANDLGNISEANLQAWPATLNTIKQKFLDPKHIVTGHQDWSNKASIEHTLDLLNKHKQRAKN